MMASARKCLITGVFVALTIVIAQAHAFDAPTPRLKPAAPGPVYLSQSDYAYLLTIADELKKKHYANALAKTEFLKDPIAKSLGQWLYYRAEDPLVNIEKADAFLDTHGDWPALSRIQAFVEDRFTLNTRADIVLDFFETRDPVSGNGRIHLARALFAKGEKEAGEIHLREGWVNYNFSISDERHILSSLGGRLTPEDHAARVDRLLFARQVTNARRVFPKLSAAERRKAEARAALLLRAATAERLYEGLPHSDQLDPGVLLAAVRYYRRTGNEEKAIALSAQAPSDPKALRNSERWWYERQLLMRWALKNGRFAEAYALSAHHGLDNASSIAEAEFNAGWIALRFLDDPARAETHFLALASVVGTPISLSRAYYWLGRSAAARKNNALAATYYKEASQYYYSYYGQLAAEELGGDAAAQKFGPIIEPTPQDKARFSARPTVAALRMLSDLDLDYEFMVFAYHTDDLLDRPGEYAALSEITNGEAAPHLTVRAGKVAIQRNAFAPNIAYPMVYVPEEAKRFVEPEIILGLSRQESEFNPRAFSRAGARGMMQLIPTTALATARKEGLTYSRNALLDDPHYNMTLGAAHLSHLLERYNGSLPLTFAAYNAGPHRADRWIEEYGDPRSANVDPVDWIELVPFAETRNYIQRVLENAQVYRGQLNNAPIPGALAADIERGGSTGRIAHTMLPTATLSLRAAEHGAQIIPPLPDSTVERVNAFRVALAEAEAAARAAEMPAPVEVAPVETDKRSRKKKRGKPVPVQADAVSKPVVQAPVIAAEETPARDAAAPAEEPAFEPAPQPAIEPAPIALAEATTSESQPEPAAAPPANIEPPADTAIVAPLVLSENEQSLADEPAPVLIQAPETIAAASPLSMAEDMETDEEEPAAFDSFGDMSEADMEALMREARAEIAESDITSGGAIETAAFLQPEAPAVHCDEDARSGAEDLNAAMLTALSGAEMHEQCSETPPTGE